jgi:tetratricopeptide (TPR) repeat protein
MKEIKIEHLVYILKQAKAKNKPKPIFFLGAGASRSGKIPLANEIAANILKEYSDHPIIKEIPDSEGTYTRLMDCLHPNERDELLKEYIDRAKINVTHIYLAQLIKEGYVDYILTVNFDNLMLRALALFNIFPSTYDMAILNDLTTSTFKEKSVVYLHGQHHGLWLLNTPEEMEKVKKTVPRIFDSIKNKRPWVFLGYSAQDPIFEHIRNLGRFDNGLYWVAYKDNYPNDNVREFLSNVNTNGFIIKGYDSDSFMLKLNKDLGLEQPMIVDKPFTALQIQLEEIVDIDEQDHFKGVKERLDISKRQVEDAIMKYELGETETTRSSSENKNDLLKREIIDLIISKKYNKGEILAIEERVVKSQDAEAKELLANLFFDWGRVLGNLAQTKSGKEAENLFQQSLDKYTKCVNINPTKFEALNNWGGVLVSLAKFKSGNEAEKFYQESFDKFHRAVQIRPKLHEAYGNWGIALCGLAKLKIGGEAEELLNQSLIKLIMALELSPNNPQYLSQMGVSLLDLAYSKEGIVAEELFEKSIETFVKALDFGANDNSFFYSYANSLQGLAKMKNGIEAENMYNLSIKMYIKAIEHKPNDYKAYNNVGFILAELACKKEGLESDELFTQSFEKFKMVFKINPNFQMAYHNLGYYMGIYAKSKDKIHAEKLLKQSFIYFRRAIELDPEDNSGYFCWGNNLGYLANIKDGYEAEGFLVESFKKYEKAIKLNPNFYQAYYQWGYHLISLAKIKGKDEAEKLYKYSFEKFKRTIELKPDFFYAFNIWGNSLLDLAKLKEGKEKGELLLQAVDKFQSVFELNGNCYNLSWTYAILGQTKEAFYFLDLSLSNLEVSVEEVMGDDPWQVYLELPEFIEIIKKHSKM